MRTDFRLLHGGEYRHFYLHRPCCTALDPPSRRRGLVIMLHGHPHLKSDSADADGWMATADANCFVVAWPIPQAPGLADAGAAHRTLAGTFAVRLASLLLRSASLRLDPSRIFVAGHGSGAEVVYDVLMREAASAPVVHPSELFAAAATSAGLPRSGESCVPSTPWPLLHVHAADDTTVPPTGRPTYDSVRTTLGSLQAAGDECRTVVNQQWVRLRDHASEASTSHAATGAAAGAAAGPAGGPGDPCLPWKSKFNLS